MSLDHLPLLFAVLVGAVGLWLVADAWLPDGEARQAERRRRARAERSRLGEGVLGAGVLALAAALAGSDRWRWGTVAVLAGAALLVIGAALNAGLLREALTHRGAARRGRGGGERREGGRDGGEAADRRLPPG